MDQLLNIMNLEDKLSQDQEINVLFLIVINGTLIMVMSNGKRKFLIMYKHNSNATVKSFIMIWFIQLTGWNNGVAQDHSVWVHNCLSINNIWLNHCLIQQYILLFIHLPICCKEIWMVLKLVFWVLDMKILPQISGISYCWVNSIPLKRYLNINWIKLDNHFCIGILWIWDALLRIWLKITWLWHCTITLQSGMILNFGHKLIIVTVTFLFKDKKCQNQLVILSLWLTQSHNMVLIQQDLHALWLAILLMTQISQNKMLTQQSFSFQHSKCLWINAFNKKIKCERNNKIVLIYILMKFSNLKCKNKLWK